jgi:hypothetical protein
MSRSTSLKITDRGSHFRGQMKSKVQPLVKSLYGFTALGTKPKSINNNIRLARELKDKFSFVYAVSFSLLFVYIYSQNNARNVRQMATVPTEAFTDTQSSRNPSTMRGSKIKRTTA